MLRREYFVAYSFCWKHFLNAICSLGNKTEYKEMDFVILHCAIAVMWLNVWQEA